MVFIDTHNPDLRKEREVLETYSFRAVPRNGIITLPLVYEEKLVEITVREIGSTTQRKRDLLSPIEIDTSGWKWNREEANERR